jgi:hypothetical protein
VGTCFFCDRTAPERRIASSCVPRWTLWLGARRPRTPGPKVRKCDVAHIWRATAVSLRARRRTAEGAGRPGAPHLDGLTVFVYGRNVTSRRCLWALALGIVVPLGCGPVEYLSQVSSRAASALAQAGQEGAEQKAPYEYAKAVAYLHKAREDAAHSNYQTAIDWGRRSKDCSRKAIARAQRPQPTGAAVEPDHTTCGEL